MTLEEFINGPGVASKDISQVFAGSGLIDQFNLQRKSGVKLPIIAYLKPKTMIINKKEVFWHEIYYLLVSEEGIIIREGKDSTSLIQRKYYK